LFFGDRKNLKLLSKQLQRTKVRSLFFLYQKKERKMKKKTGVLIFVAVLAVIVLSLNAVHADETDVVVKGMKGYVWNVTLNVINAASGNLVISIENDTSASTGLANFRYSSASQTVTYYVVARSNGKIMASRSSASVGNFSTGSGLTTIDLFPGTTTTTTTPVVIINTSTSQTNDTETDSSDIATETTGNTTTIDLGSKFNLSGTFAKIKSGLKASSKWILYGLLILAVIGAMIYAIFWWIRRPKQIYDFSKKSENLTMPGDNERLVSRNNRDGRKIEDELASAEQKIKEAQEEIARIRNKKEKLTTAKQKYEQAKRDLEEVETDM